MTDATLNTQEISTLQAFKNKAVEFMTAYNKLISMDADVAPALRAEYNTLRKSATVVMNTIKTVTTSVDKVTGFFSGAYDAASNAFKAWFGLGILPGFDTTNTVRNYFNNPSPGLGFAPLIPIAAVIAASAAMAGIISQVYQFERKNSIAKTEQARLESQGVSPQEAAKIVNQQLQTASGSGLDIFGLKKLVMPLGLGILGFIAYKLFAK